MNKYLVFASIGFELIGAILVAIYAAEFLEKSHPSKGLWTLVFLVTVLAAWFIHIIYLLKKVQKNDNDSSSNL